MIHSATKSRIDWDAVKVRLLAAQQAFEESSTADEASMREIFHQRAQRLATRSSNAESSAEAIPVVAFTVGAETYGIELRYVAQVFPDLPITPVPGAPDALLGVANLQGEVRSVLGARRLLSLADDGGETNHYILLLRHDDRKIGLQIEQIEDVRRIAVNDLVDSEDDSAARQSGYVRGVTRNKIVILNGDAFFTNPEL